MENYEMIAGVTGTGTVHMNELEALLDWFLPVYCRLEIDPDANPIVKQWCDEVDQEYVIDPGRKGSCLIESLMSWQDNDYEVALIVLGVEGSEEVINLAWNAGIEVYDLTRALYQVTRGDDLELVVYEPQTQAHEVSDGLGGRGSLDVFAPENGSESHAGDNAFLSIMNAVVNDLPHPDLKPVTWPADNEPELSQKELVQRIEAVMAGIINLHEQRYHSDMVTDRLREGFDIADPSRDDDGRDLRAQAMADSIDEFRKDRIRCLKNQKTGEIRVAPRAKLKSGEEEIWLTEEEVSNLESQAT